MSLTGESDVLWSVFKNNTSVNGVGGFAELQGMFGDRDGYGIQVGIKWDF